MRIGIDYTPAVRQRAGIGRILRGLVGALAEIDPINQYVLLTAGRSAKIAGTAFPVNFHHCAIPLSERLLAILWHRLRLPLPVNLWAGSLDLFHAPDFVLPPVYRSRTLVTIHDLSFLRYPACADARLRAYLAQVVPRSVRRADRVLADSRSTADDLMTLLGVPAARIAVVYGGVGPEFCPVTNEAQLEAVCARYGLRRPFILAVGTIEPRKNYSRLVEAVARLRQHQPQLTLVIVGAKGWLYQELFATIERLGQGSAVLFPGYVADTDLPAIYSAAAAFAFPSLYEGFGFPVLEAMACGTPVVCSNVSSLPEVAGEAALQVSPEDVNALTAALSRLLADPALRTDLIARGREQAARFPWSAAATTLLQVYRGMMER